LFIFVGTKFKLMPFGGGKATKMTKVDRKLKRSIRKDARKRKRFNKWSGLDASTANEAYNSWAGKKTN
jgi:hypothetical protein